MEYIFIASIILVGCMYYAVKTYIVSSQYTRRSKKCTKKITVTVDNFKESKELMYLSKANSWYVHTFSDPKNPDKKYYNRFGKCSSYAIPGKQTTILINPDNPDEFFYPGEAKPRTTDGILCGVMAVFMILVIIMLINNPPH